MKSGRTSNAKWGLNLKEDKSSPQKEVPCSTSKMVDNNTIPCCMTFQHVQDSFIEYRPSLHDEQEQEWISTRELKTCKKDISTKACYSCPIIQRHKREKL